MKYRIFLPATPVSNAAQEPATQTPSTPAAPTGITLGHVIARDAAGALEHFLDNMLFSFETGRGGYGRDKTVHRIGEREFLRTDVQAEEAVFSTESIDRSVLVGAQLAREALVVARGIVRELTPAASSERTTVLVDLIFPRIFDHASRTTTER